MEPCHYFLTTTHQQCRAQLCLLLLILKPPPHPLLCPNSPLNGLTYSTLPCLIINNSHLTILAHLTIAYSTRPLQPLQRPYTGPFPFTPVTNNTFNNYYRPTINSNLASSSNPQNELPRYITNAHMQQRSSIEQLAQDNARGEDNNESASGEDEEGEEGEQHSSDGDYSSESE
ncbi:hypothetical protein Tco_0756568 [Tanacetum coccineum]